MQTAMGNPGFSGLVAGDLGSDGTVADGFDALVLALSNQVIAELAAGPGLDSIILAADFSGDSVYSPQWSDAVSSFASLSAAGNSILAQTLGILATAPGKPPAMPAPTPAPAPVVPAPVKGPPVYTGGGGIVFNPGVPTGPIVPVEYCKNYASDTDICPSEQ
jgi:hypothetical protein